MQEYDPLSAAMIDSPYAKYQELIDTDPIHWHDAMQAWVVVRHRDCVDVLQNHAVFCRDPRRVGQSVPRARQNIQMLDPPKQTPLRKVFVKSLLEQDLDQIVDGGLEPIRRFLQSRPASVEWMNDVASPFALEMSTRLLGVPRPNESDYGRISHGIALRMDTGLQPENAIPGDAARDDLNALGESWFPLAEDCPARLLAAMAHNAEGNQEAQHLLRNSAAMIFNASFGTLFAMAGSLANLLAERPEVFEELESIADLSTGVDELVRFDGPAQGTSRIAVASTELSGVAISPGETVVTILAAANRDPAVFDQPEQILLNRRPNPHLGFGSGPHACFGSNFARVALAGLVGLLFEEKVQLSPEGFPTRRTTATVRSFDTLPLKLGR